MRIARASIEDLVVVDPSGRETVLGQAVLTIGASVECDFVVPAADPRVPVAARVTADYVEAVERCVLGGVPLEVGNRRSLAGACSLRVAGATFRIEARAPRAVSTRRLAFDLASLGTEPALVVVEGPDVDHRLAMPTDREYVLGRSSRCDLMVSDTAASREHAAVVRRGDTVLLRDLGSGGGTYLGGVRLARGALAVWAPESMVLIGSTVLALRSPEITTRALESAGIEAPEAPFVGQAAVAQAASDTSMSNGEPNVQAGPELNEPFPKDTPGTAAPMATTASAEASNATTKAGRIAECAPFVAGILLLLVAAAILVYIVLA
jgi:hypothetical protein